MKPCRLCGATKKFAEYYKCPGTKDGHRSECIVCTRAQRKTWYGKNRKTVIARTKKWQTENRERHLATQRKRRAENRDELRERDRRGWLAKKYGLTPELFEELLESQGGACAVCGRVLGKDLHVDHDHHWNEVRGLLCGSCNRGIGLLQENPQNLYKAAKYLTDHKIAQYEKFITPFNLPLEEIPAAVEAISGPPIVK